MKKKGRSIYNVTIGLPYLLIDENEKNHRLHLLGLKKAVLLLYSSHSPFTSGWVGRRGAGPVAGVGGGCNYVMHYYIETYMCVDAFACSAHMRVIFMQTFKYSIAW